MKKKTSFLFSLLMAIVMMAMCPATLLAADGDKPWLCFTAQQAGSTVQLIKHGSLTSITFEISTNGSTWKTYYAGISGTTITLANVGDKVYFRNESETASSSFSTSSSDYYQFVMSGKIAASGNVMSLMDKTCQKTNLTGASYAFYQLFYGCTSLTAAPALPATTLADYCYNEMFYFCSSLTTAPALQATTLADYCYNEMFSGCSSLTTAPALPATTLADYCYMNMFDGCSSLTTAPVLPATTLAASCYKYMFYRCSSLASIPALPATTLANDCYNNMFDWCSSLKINTSGSAGYAWSIPTASTATSWNYWMFWSTGGTFTGDPTIGTTYYLASTPSVKLNSEGYATYSTYFNAHIETEGVKAYKATVNGTNIVLTELNGDIPAGKGVLLYGEGKGGATVTFSASASAATNASGNALKPTTITPCVIEAKPAAGFNYALSGNEFKKYTGASFIHNRAFLNLNTDYSGSSVKGMSIVFADDEATAINNVNVNANVNAKRVENGRIVILNNGRKYNTAGQQMK